MSKIALPQLGIVVTIAPVGRQVIVEQPRHLVREPRRHVDAVGDGAHRPLLALRTPGHIGAHISRVTTPCSWLTALTPSAVRSASAVMLNCGPEPLSYAPSCMKRSRYSPSVPQQPARCVSTRLNGKRVVPRRNRRVRGEDGRAADLGERRRRSSCPCSMRSRIRCSTTNAAWPSFRCQATGCDPSAFSARTPPMPRMISCCTRVSRSPP